MEKKTYKTKIHNDPPNDPFLEITISEFPRIVLEVFYKVEAKVFDRSYRDEEGDFIPASLGGIVEPESANLMIAEDDWSNDTETVRGFSTWDEVPAILQVIEKAYRPDAEALGFKRSDFVDMLED